MTKTNEIASPPETEELVNALSTIVDAMIRHREKMGRHHIGKFTFVSAFTLCSTPSQTWSEKEWCKDPVDRAIKRGVKDVGRIIHGRIGDGKMLDMAEAVCDRDEANWGRRMAILNSAFDGIGSWYA